MSAAAPVPTGPPPRFALSVVPDGAEVRVELRGALDLAAADVLDDAVRALRRRAPARVVLDLREVDFLDSTGLRILLTLRNDAKREGRVLELVPGPREVQRVFELTRTRGLFDWRRA